MINMCEMCKAYEKLIIEFGNDKIAVEKYKEELSKFMSLQKVIK